MLLVFPYLKYLLLNLLSSLYNSISVLPLQNSFKELSNLSIVVAVVSRSSTLTWKIPWMEEPGRLQSMGSLGVGHDWVTSLSLFTFMHWRRQWQPTPVFLPEESQGRGTWWAAISGVAQSRTRLKRLSSSSSVVVILFLCSLESSWKLIRLSPLPFYQG